MKITEIKLRELSGTLETKNVFWEERLVMPLDIYPDYRNQSFVNGRPETNLGFNMQKGLSYPISAIFIEIKTDEGATGIGGPIDKAQAHLIKD